MVLNPDQEMAYKIVKLYIKHSMDEKQKKSLTLDRILDSYYYTLGRMQNKIDRDPLAPAQEAPKPEDTDAFSSNPFRFLE